MEKDHTSEIFVAVAPGLETALRRELEAAHFNGPMTQVPGGVVLPGGWQDAMRANLHLRVATRVLIRIATFRAPHLAQLDKRARKLDWASVLRPDLPVRVDATCRKSRIYHKGAAAERVGKAIADQLGCPIVKEASAEAVIVKVRIEDDLCAISLDTSGEPLHRRGHKEAVGKAPLRETLAAAFLTDCGFDGTQTVVDPMCGSGTFVLEAAEIAAGLAPGRSRSFAFEQMGGFDPKFWDQLRRQLVPKADPTPKEPPRLFGYDRDDGAIRNATANATRAGVSDRTHFARQAISDLEPPEGPPGLVMVNPPYGARIGNRKLLFALYGSFGQVMRARFQGWRVGMVTSDPGLAKATNLPFLPAADPVNLGGLKVQLWRTDPLP